MDDLIQKIKDQEKTENLDKIIELTQELYDEGVIFQIHSHELNGVRTFTASQEILTEMGMVRKLKKNTNKVEDWSLVEHNDLV